MTLDDIRDSLEKIKASVGDDEAAHGLEDALYRDFINYVSQLDVLNGENLQDKAALILTTEEMDFARWCA